MKKNVIVAIIAGVVLILLGIYAYHLNEKNKADEAALQRDIEGLKKIRKITGESKDYFSPTFKFE